MVNAVRYACDGCGKYVEDRNVQDLKWPKDWLCTDPEFNEFNSSITACCEACIEPAKRNAMAYVAQRLAHRVREISAATLAKCPAGDYPRRLRRLAE